MRGRKNASNSAIDIVTAAILSRVTYTTDIENQQKAKGLITIANVVTDSTRFRHTAINDSAAESEVQVRHSDNPKPGGGFTGYSTG